MARETVVRKQWLIVQVGEYSVQECSSPWDNEPDAWEGAARRAAEDHERYTVMCVVCRRMRRDEDEGPGEFPLPGFVGVYEGEGG